MIFGLVVTSPFRLRFRRPAATSGISEIPKPLALEDELHARGVRTYPLQEVREFQKMYLREQIGIGSAGELAQWVRSSPVDFENDFGPIPKNIRRTIDRVETIPGTKVFVERFFEDPFLFIERPRENAPREVCCIGYWDTPFQPK